MLGRRVILGWLGTLGVERKFVPTFSSNRIAERWFYIRFIYVYVLMKALEGSPPSPNVRDYLVN